MSWRTRLVPLAGILLVLGSTHATATRQSTRPQIRVSAERFSFTPSEIKLQVGDEVELRLSSQDTAHGFRVADLDIDVQIPKRGSGEISVTFKAEKAGRFTIECSHVCGAGHNFMRGAIVVRPRVPGDER